MQHHVDGVDGRREPADVEGELRARASVHSAVPGLAEGLFEVHGCDELVGSVLVGADAEAVLARVHQLREAQAVPGFLHAGDVKFWIAVCADRYVPACGVLVRGVVRAASDVDDAVEVAKKVGYPVLVRPSYVLGGQRMRIVINDEELESAVVSLLKHIPDNKILIDHFLDRCQEAEIDGIFDGEEFHVMGVMEHIEPAGIHSGDSNAVLPAFNLTPLEVTTMEFYAEKIARALDIRGLINIQFAIKNGQVFVIEANPRASRTTPFIAKAYQIPYLNIATKIMMGTHKIKDFQYEKKLEGFAIKEPVFSFDKFPGVSKELGPEMKSTGEAIRFVKDLRDPYFRTLYKERSMHLSK